MGPGPTTRPATAAAAAAAAAADAMKGLRGRYPGRTTRAAARDDRCRPRGFGMPKGARLEDILEGRTLVSVHRIRSRSLHLPPPEIVQLAGAMRPGAPRLRELLRLPPQFQPYSGRVHLSTSFADSIFIFLKRGLGLLKTFRLFTPAHQFRGADVVAPLSTERLTKACHRRARHHSPCHQQTRSRGRWTRVDSRLCLSSWQPLSGCPRARRSLR